MAAGRGPNALRATGRVKTTPTNTRFLLHTPAELRDCDPQGDADLPNAYRILLISVLVYNQYYIRFQLVCQQLIARGALNAGVDLILK